MKPRTTLVLAAVLVVLGGIAFLVQWSRQRSFSSPGKPVFPGYSSEKADGIDILGKGKEVQLRKRGNSWVVATEGGHEADPKATKQILEAVDGFSSATPISNSPEKHSTFEVDSAGMTIRMLQGGKSVAEFLVGKPGPDYMSTYVRPVRENKVYLLPSYLRSMIDRGGETWRNTMVLDLDAANVTGLTARSSKMTLSCEKDAAGNWKVTEPFSAPAKPDIMSMILRSTAQLRASGFADSTLTDAAAGLVPDTTRIEVKTSDGSTYAIVVGAMNDKRQSYTKKDGDPTIYLVPRGRFNTVFRDPTLLKAEEPQAPAPQ